MKATQLLHNLGQSLWLDNITRDLLDRGAFERYIDELSVASVFVSRWDAAVAGKVPTALNNRLGIAIANRTYQAYRGRMDSPRCALQQAA